MIRNLTISNSVNLNGTKEFNHLRIRNLIEFLNSYENNLDYYKKPFEIISKLESLIAFENNPDQTILVPYKEDGDVIFQLEKIVIEGSLRVVYYYFDSFIS